MIIKELHIINYKNLADLSFEFCPGFNCLIGDNGAGKTNVLDAIYMLSMCKSFFNLPDNQNVKHDEDFFMLRGNYLLDDDSFDITCSYKQGQKKMLKKDSKIYGRLSEHIGVLPLIMISPEDIVLIEGGSTERRKLLDSIISQCDRTYLQHLIAYNKALMQRNSLLKSSEGHRIDPESIEIWDDQLALHGDTIRKIRQDFILEFTPLFKHYYHLLTSGKEDVELSYAPSSHEEDMLYALRQCLRKDSLLGYTSIGIHRDDLNLNIEGFNVRKFGSQGQKKSFLIALKLAQYTWTSQKRGFKPLLLLDDISDKLDSQRMEQLLQIVASDDFGQTFITDTNDFHLNKLNGDKNPDYSLFKMHHGEIF